jgi:hypothetical protein
VVDARFALAVWTLTFGPFAVETSVPSDACHPWHWSLSALVTVGAGRCEKPHSINREIQRSTKEPVPSEGRGQQSATPLHRRGWGLEGNGAGSRRLRSEPARKIDRRSPTLESATVIRACSRQARGAPCILRECCNRAIPIFTLPSQYQASRSPSDQRGLARPGTRSAGAVCRAADSPSSFSALPATMMRADRSP